MRKYLEISGRAVPAKYSITDNVVHHLTDGVLENKCYKLKDLKYSRFFVPPIAVNLTVRRYGSIMGPLYKIHQMVT
jgi:hypothetical protein